MGTQEISSRLVNDKEQLEKRIKAIEKDLANKRSQDFAEQAGENENNEVLEEILSETHKELNLVNSAIARLSSGQYATCSNCDNPINPERLSALPYTNTCINCAE